MTFNAYIFTVQSDKNDMDDSLKLRIQRFIKEFNDVLTNTPDSEINNVINSIKESYELSKIPKNISDIFNHLLICLRMHHQYFNYIDHSIAIINKLTKQDLLYVYNKYFLSSKYWAMTIHADPSFVHDKTNSSLEDDVESCEED